MGNGQFQKSSFSVTTKPSGNNAGFMLQDINGDGLSDLLKYQNGTFYTYLCANNKFSALEGLAGDSNTKAVLIPTNINSHSYFSQLLCLVGGIVTKWSFQRNDSKEVLLTGMANSLGNVEKNYYFLTNREANDRGTYSVGYGAVFPYVNLQEPITVLGTSELYMDGSRIDRNTYSYTNAVFHKQGLGFRGFESVRQTNNKGQNLTQVYEPYRYSLLKSEESPEFRNTYTYSVSAQSNKLLKVRMTSKVELDRLKNITVTSNYTYDTYGNATRETATYPDGITSVTTNTYFNNTIESYYLLGFLTDQTVTMTSSGSSYTQRKQILSHTRDLPIEKIIFINGSKSKEYFYRYDSGGNLIREMVKPYTSNTDLVTDFTYDTYGRLTKVINQTRQTESFQYNAAGQVSEVTNYKGGKITYAYDGLGREITVTTPDGRRVQNQYSWMSGGTNGLYAITQTNTSNPTICTIYDALNREVRITETRFNGTKMHVDKIYDSYGRIQKESLPFTGNSATAWKTYSHDSYDRPTAIAEPSGRRTTYSYSGNSVTRSQDGISSTYTYNALGHLIKATDPAGTITYNLRPDGQLSSIVAPGNVTTSFAYDTYGRQTRITDPSFGATSYIYNEAGNVSQETDANNKAIKFTYDAYNRVVTKVTPEFTTTYRYNSHNELISESTNNGTSITYSYDELGRLKRWKETIMDGKWLQRDYTYTAGKISSIKYTSQTEVIVTENYVYSNGHLSEIKINNSTSIRKLSKENALGQTTEMITNGVTRNYDFNAYGLPTARRSKSSSTTFQNFSYSFDAAKGNLTNRKDNGRNRQENFAYDNLNRLTSYNGNTATYDVKGNLTRKSDAGTFTYANSQKPYAISGATIASGSIPQRKQDVTYTSFKRPSKITENGYIATLTYNGQHDRVKMHVTKNGAKQLTRYYMGGCYELDEMTGTSKKEKLYLGGDFYSAPAVYVKEDNGSWQLYNICRDYLGSITHITNNTGSSVKQELSYDAWGRLRNPANFANYAPDKEPDLFLGRGYTGHEHLTWFGLVNMNARLYDPAIGRFLSPDPYVQAPDFSQNFNRYTYAMNNPLKYVDENGEFIHLIIGAVIGGVVNVAANWKRIDNFWKGLGYFGVGAAAGALSAGVGAGVSSAMAGGSFGAGFIGTSAAATATSSFISGSAIGAGAGFAGGFTSGMGNSLLQGKSLGKSLGSGAVTGLVGGAAGGLLGGVVGGVSAVRDGRNFMHGGRLIEDVQMQLPQMNQTGQLDCRYETFRSIDEYYNGSTSTVESLRNAYPNVEIDVKQMGKMYGRRSLSVRDLIRENSINLSNQDTQTAQSLANFMNQNQAIIYEVSVGQINGVNYGQAMAINRIRIWDNGKILINFMDPNRGIRGSKNFSNVIKIFRVIP